MSPHSALTSWDIQLLFEAADGDGSIHVVDREGTLRVEANDQSFTEVGREGVGRLQACGYLEGGPEVFRVTRAGREYAESMR